MAQFYQQQQNMMQSQFMPNMGPIGNSVYNLGMQPLGQGPNAADLQPNQP